MKDNFTLGLDIGIASIGWSILNNEKKRIEDFGVRIFNEATPAANERSKRSARRNLRRKNWRKQQLKQAFVDFGLLTKEEVFDNKDFASYTVNNESIKKPNDETVYHLRKRILRETQAVSNRELFLALYSICGTRGHFLMETVDFSKGNVSYELFREKFYNLISPYIEINNKVEFEKSVLQRTFTGKIDSKSLKVILSNNYCEKDEMDNALLEVLKLLNGYKALLSKIHEEISLDDVSGTLNVMDLIKREELNDFLNGIVELYDLRMIYQVLNQYEYICDKQVASLDEFKQKQSLIKDNKDDYLEYEKSIKNKMGNSKKTHLRVVRNLENKFPNGLYFKEARDLLKNQQKYNSKITNEFIDICCSIISARIPYYIGPLNENGKNAWLTKIGNFKYSYGYSKGKAVDEENSIKVWKERMISRCTYLPDEFALPKGSFIHETFNILNELNVLTAKDNDNNTYYLTGEDKVKLFNHLFLRKEGAITYKDIAKELDLKYFGTKNNNKTSLNNKYTLYHSIKNIVPELSIDNIMDIFSIHQSVLEKADKLERLILDINLFDEEATREDYISKNYDFSEDASKKLGKLSSKGFFALSKKFIMQMPLNEYGQCIMEKLFETNYDSHNEQMTLINNATDKNGDKMELSANKYVAKLNKNNELDINLLFDGDKPVIPISRPVIRALNECMKLYNEVIKTYGVPSRVVIETTRDFKDGTKSGKPTAKHSESMRKLYDSLEQQMKEHRNNPLYISYLDDWDQIVEYLSKNKRKVELYLRQNGKDMISGDRIDITHLEEYEIDHILPRGFGDNSMDDLMLINKLYNSKKNNRVPLQYLENDDVRDKDGNRVTTSDFVNRCKALYDMKTISDKKLEMLLLENDEDVQGFINRNLVDTSYIVSEFMSILRAYNKVNNNETHIVTLKGALTAVYRDAFEINKVRDYGDQHHAYDAVTVALADAVLSTYYPHYDQRGDYNSYKSFINSIHNQEERQDVKRVILNAYKKAFGNYPNEEHSIISKVKSMKPLYSLKAEKNYTGAFFEETIYAPKSADSNDPLTILGVNNSTRSFSGIECVAVDFYKYTNSKGNKVHLGVHIPKVIVDKNGNINQEKYLKLISNYYNANELIDEFGNLKEHLFRFRAFRNDLVYDTGNQEIQIFNLGSIANKKLELKQIYCFAYDELYNQSKVFEEALIKQFDIKKYSGSKRGRVLFKDIDKKELLKYCFDYLFDYYDINRYKASIENSLNKIDNLSEFSIKMSFMNNAAKRKRIPPTVVGQYKPVANSINEEAEYYKIKSSILGIRYSNNERGKLEISGPFAHPEKFSKIKKESFSWKMSKDMLQ